ncbi:MAG: transpeptidase family protein [Bradymonadales bacterium]|nr:transpeptidase family protein [Bradymonadales bacterium]
MNEGGQRAVEERRSDDLPDKPILSQWRGALVVLVLCLLFGAVMGRTLELQVERFDDLTREAEAQLVGGIEIRARRGAIYDRNGGELAVSVRAESIFARPHELVSVTQAAASLAPLLGASEASLIQEMAGPQRFRWLARRVAPHTASQIRQLAIPGIHSTTEWQRFYPMRVRAGHLLGFVGDDGYGLEGIERSLDATLSGGVMEVRGLRDAYGRPLISREAPDLQQLEGSSIVLTIDATLQRIAERELERVILEQSARTGVILVMDPQSGEVLAMASWPLFDPNRFRSSHAADWRNRAITDCWEPGSTFKTFTYAAALEADVIEPETRIECGQGRAQVGQYRISDSRRGIGTISAWQVIQVSSNVGIYRISQRLGQERFHQAIRQFGFGEPSGIGLAGEQRGLVATPPWAEIELANRAFGQGIATTPIQLALAYSVIANGGELMEPQLVREVRSLDGRILETREPRVRHRVISRQTAVQVTEALESVVVSPGTGTRAALSGIRVAGKTGTAQKVDPETGLYGDLWMASFAGFVPADDPQFTIVVMIDEPQVDHYGGVVAAPVFARVAEQALATRAVFTDQAGEAQESAPATAADPVPQETVPQADPEEPPVFSPPTDDSERVTVPDFTLLTLSEALELAESEGIQLTIHGWGLVRHQWPAVGARVRRGSGVDLYLRGQYELSWDLTTRMP